MTCRSFFAGSLLTVAISISFAQAAAAASGDTASEFAPPASPITPAQALALVIDAYQRGPVADRVQIRVIPANTNGDSKGKIASDRAGGERRATAVVRVDRGDAAGFRPRQLRLELGSLLIHADHSLLLAISRLEPRSCFETELPEGLKPDRLTAVLPPLPLPQIAIALGGDRELTSPVSYVRGVTWSSVESRTLGGKPTYAILGRGRAGDVVLTIDQVTGRVRQFSADVLAGGGEGRLRLELACTPLDAGDPQSWPLNSEGRERVAAIDLLGPRAGDVTIGQRFPTLPILDATLAPFSVSDVFAPATPPGALVLVAFRPSADTEEARLILADAKAGIAAIEGLGIKSPRGVAPLAIRPIAVLEGDEIAVERLAAWTARWDAVDQKYLGQKFGSMLSTSSTGIALDRFGPGLAAALIVIAADQRVLGVVPLDGRADDEGAIRREFIAASGAESDAALRPPSDDAQVGPPVPTP